MSPAGSHVELTFSERIELMRLVQELREPAMYGPGIVGLLEARNLFARLFLDFALVRDGELDTMLDNYVDTFLNAVEKSPVGPISDFQE